MTITVEHLSETPEYRYDMSEEELRQLATELLTEREPITNDRFVCYELDGSEKAANLGRVVERSVFEKRFEHTSEEMKHEYGAYERNSVFYVTLDRVTSLPVGAVRAITASPELGERSFKSVNDLVEIGPPNPPYPHTQAELFEHYGIDDLTKCWDIGTAAVLPRYGGGEVSSQIYRAMWVASQRRGVEHFFSMIARKPYEMMQLVGFPFEKIYDADWVSYLNSESLPVYGAAPTFDEAVRQQEARTGEDLMLFLHDSFRVLGHGDHDDALMLR
jgi:hypothetical protein